jgi:Tol biopolymer transport system component
MVKNIVLIIIVISTLNCGENIFNENIQFKYSNPIGAINLTKDYKEYENFTPGWSEDCSYIIYLTRITKNVEIPKYIVNKLDLINKEKYSYNIKYFSEFYGPPVISPDGRWFVYSGGIPGNNFDIYRVDANNPEGEPERLTYKGYSNGDGVLSPDGQWIAFTSQREPHIQTGSEVYIMKFEPESSINEPTRLTFHDKNGSFCENLLFSPDDNWILYTCTRGQNNVIYKINLSNGMQAQEEIIVKDVDYITPTDISPDGKWIAIFYRIKIHTKDGNQLVIGYVSSDSGEQEIHDFFPTLEEGCDCWSPSFSPDGKWVSFVSEMENKEGETDIFLYPFNPEE